MACCTCSDDVPDRRAGRARAAVSAGGVTEIWCNSCPHRACPRCSSQRINQWLNGWQAQILRTDHFHVIFTLPSESHELWQWNRAALTEVLFSSVRETLLTLLRRPNGWARRPGS